MDKNNQTVLSFASISGKKVQVDFDGGNVTSDGGALLLRWVESGLGVVRRLEAAMRDRRHPSYVDHALGDLLRQRVFQMACGYEDANDSNTLRVDPTFKVAVDRLPLSGADLASQPTMSRLENSVSRPDLYRMARALVDTFIASYEKPPQAIILDLDDTDDPTHGTQQRSLFNGYYDEKCYLPLHIYEGQSGKLITTILRPGCRPTGAQIVSLLKRVVAYLRKHWPQVQIFLRGDSHFSAPEVHDFCAEQAIRFALGQAGNTRLDALAQPLLAQAHHLHKAQRQPVRLFTSFTYQAHTWSTPQRIVCKVEVSAQGPNVRFVSTNLRSSQPSFIYGTIYCARGRMEGFIKNHKTFLHSDRTSCHRFEANQFRLLLHSAAYVLLHTLAEKGLPNTPWRHAYFDTIQKRLLKVGARVREVRTKIKFHFPTSFPLQEVYVRIVANLARAFP
tara:strand:+ start:118 stop:1458 length:1341 start_codon:yes stop_codon:yes gene_type:complete